MWERASQNKLQQSLVSPQQSSPLSLVMDVLEHPCKMSMCACSFLSFLYPSAGVSVPPSSQACILEVILHSGAVLLPRAFGVFPPCWCGLIICSWKAKEMGGSHEVPAEASEIQFLEAWAARANQCSCIRHSKYNFTSVRKKKKMSSLLICWEQWKILSQLVQWKDSFAVDICLIRQ